ncbi:hypothetical protein ACIQC5_17740 [Paenarthrobacter sp. NPDC092416]|uniref:hypothetical protein n=1 Tax=Paenarthrobacter sp. NPDC092416 TaxID=3364386 RepID=UPI00381E8E27
MSEQIAPSGRNSEDAEQAIDRLLAESDLGPADGIRTELLQLRALASASPEPSVAVRALMTGGSGAVTSQLPTAVGPFAGSGEPTAVPASVAGRHFADALPFDELAARRRRKRRAAIAGLAVAVSLAGGATAAVASEGGISGAFQHLGTAIGSVVSQFTPGGNSPERQSPAVPADQQPHRDVAPPYPAPVGPHSSDPANPAGGANLANPPSGGAQGGAEHSNSSKTPIGVPRTPRIPGNGESGNVTVPTPPVAPITPPGIDVPSVAPSDIPVPVPSHVVPEAPGTP